MSVYRGRLKAFLFRRSFPVSGHLIAGQLIAWTHKRADT